MRHRALPAILVGGTISLASIFAAHAQTAPDCNTEIALVSEYVRDTANDVDPALNMTVWPVLDEATALCDSGNNDGALAVLATAKNLLGIE
jgi:hypothetical protein